MRLFMDDHDYLIHLIRCAIHDDAPSELPDGAMFDSVYKCGTEHDVANIAYYSVVKLQTKPEAELVRKWEAKMNSAVVRDMNQSFARTELLDEFKSHGIRSVEVQGTKIKKLYPAPEYRTMSDIDFIIEKEHLDTAARILDELGYEYHYFRGAEINAFRQPNIIIEIHTDFFPDDSDYRGELTVPFDEKTEPGESVAVSDELLYLYNVMHIAKHYFLAGCGIRRILDLYILNKKYPDIAEGKTARDLFADLGILDFVRDASELAECWFGDSDKLPDERLNGMIGKIKASGVHGTLHHKLNNRLERDKENGRGNVKARYVLSRLFPAKWVMTENYPVLKKWPLLMPFCWGHRLFRAMTKNRGRIKEEMNDLKNADMK